MIFAEIIGIYIIYSLNLNYLQNKEKSLFYQLWDTGQNSSFFRQPNI